MRRSSSDSPIRPCAACACRSLRAGRSARRATARAGRPASASSRAARRACTRRTCRRRAARRSRRGAVRVVEHHAALGKVRLTPVVVRHGRLNWRKRSSIARSDGSCSTSCLPTARATASLVRSSTVGPETARAHCAVGALEHVLQHRREAVGVVADGVLRVHVDAVVGERCAMYTRSCRQVAEQNLGADRDDLDGCHQRLILARAERRQLVLEPRGYDTRTSTRSLPRRRSSRGGGRPSPPAACGAALLRARHRRSARTSRRAPLQRPLKILPTRGATPPVEIPIRTGPALTMACIATKP